MESAMDSTTSMNTPPQQVDDLIQMVADEHGLQISDEMQAAATGPIQAKQTAEPENADPAKDLESRLAALRN